MNKGSVRIPERVYDARTANVGDLVICGGLWSEVRYIIRHAQGPEYSCMAGVPCVEVRCPNGSRWFGQSYYDAAKSQPE